MPWFLAFLAWNLAYVDGTVACVALILAFCLALAERLMAPSPERH